MAPKFPRLILWLLRTRFGHRAEYITGDLLEEYNARGCSRFWLWRQALSTFWPGAPKTTHLHFPRSKEDAMIGSFFSSFSNDLRYAARTLRTNPGFTAVAVLAIALGIGVNTGIFTVLNGAALRPLPVPGASEMVSIYQDITGRITRNVHGASSFFTTSEYETYRDENDVFSGLLAYEPFLTATLGGERPQQLLGQLTACNYFDVLKERPTIGRGFAASECVPGGTSAVVVLNHDLWHSVFADDPTIVGKKILLNRQLFTVIGVASTGFQGTEPATSAFWAPLPMQPSLEPRFDAYNGNYSWLVVLGRTKPGVSRKQVRADLGVIAARIDQLTPGRKTTLTVGDATFLGMPEARKYVYGAGAVLLTAVGMVLLIACANVANLLLARAAGRRKEIAIRLSVGASRARLVRQLLTESMLIALLGGALGSLLAVWSFNAITAFVMAHLPHGTPQIMMNFHPDIRVFLYALAMSTITGIAFGLAPALAASRPDVNAALKDEGMGLGARSARGFLRQSLVGVQVTVSMMLLISAGLLLRALHYAQTIDPGFEMKNIATVSLELQSQGYNAESGARFNRQLRERLASSPGVDRVAQALTTPLSDRHHGTAVSLPGDTRQYPTELNRVSPEYFAMIGLPIVRGRNFTEAEVATGAKVALVTESTAQRLWPGKDPIGQIFRDVDGTDAQVIGVAKDAQVSRIAETNTKYMYLPAGPKDQLRTNFLVHSASGYAATAKGIVAVIHQLDPNLVADVARLEENLELWRTPSRIVAGLAGALGGLGLILASIGVYGVVSYSMSRRIREIGLRMTLGAEARDVLHMMLAQAMRPVIVGAVLGIAGCAAVSAVLKSILFGISPHDPIAFIAVPVILLAAALGASYIPARRATKVDPMVALRYE